MTGRPLTAVELQQLGEGAPIWVQWARSTRAWPMTLRFVRGEPSAWTRGGEPSAVPGEGPAESIFAGFLRPGLTPIDDRVWRDASAAPAAPELFPVEQKRKD
jgi:hypothetical protein